MRRNAKTTMGLAMGSAAAALVLAGAAATAQESVQLPGPACTTPAYLHCPDENCTGDRVINPGAVVEMNSRRTYFLDYPCDLEPEEQVTFILSLHGGGSYANWQRHYFPLLDYKDSHRLVIATPSSPIRVWTEADDQYLQDIVTSVVDQLGKDHIKAFWLVGHSQGGMTSNRLLRTEFFARRVDGFLSLSGGRIGGNPPMSPSFGPPRSASAASSSARTAGSPTGDQVRRSIAEARARLSQLPDAEFSFIFSTGEREMGEGGLPESSQWAEKLGCGARKRLDDVVDSKPGYVYDGTRQDPPNPSWGLTPAPGTAEVYRYQGCKDGRIVADVVRLEKGHTEGYEPKVTQRLVELMLSAKGGKIRNLD